MTPKSRDDTRIFNKNKFKLGLFGMNCQGGLSLTKAPERWDASWDHNVQAATLADEAGLEFLLPIARSHRSRSLRAQRRVGLEPDRVRHDGRRARRA